VKLKKKKLQQKKSKNYEIEFSTITAVDIKNSKALKMATGDFGLVVYNEFNFGFMISWKEFEKLQEFQKTKEDSVKFRTSKIESSTNENLNDIVPLSLIEPQKIVDDSSNYTVYTDMQFTMNSENNLVLEYEILRESGVLFRNQELGSP
jgi:hypothetical protein